MNAHAKLLAAIQLLGEQLERMALPEDAGEMLDVVLQRQQLLEAYLAGTAAVDIDTSVIHEVLAGNARLLSTTQEAHSDAGEALSAAMVGRNAVTAYLDSEVP